MLPFDVRKPISVMAEHGLARWRGGTWTAPGAISALSRRAFLTIRGGFAMRGGEGRCDFGCRHGLREFYGAPGKGGAIGALNVSSAIDVI